MKKHLLLMITIAATLSACSNDDKKDSKKGFDRTLPKATALNQAEIEKIKFLVQPIGQIDIEELVLFSENDDSDDRNDRLEEIEKKDLAVRNWIGNINKNCKINLLKSSTTQTPDTDDIVVGKVVTETENGSILDVENSSELCGLNANSSSLNKTTFTSVDTKSDYSQIKMNISTNKQSEIQIKDPYIIETYKVNRISKTVQSNSKVELYKSKDSDKTFLTSQIDGNVIYFKNNSQDSIKFEMNMLMQEEQQQVAVHTFFKFSELSKEVVVSVLMDSKNKNPLEYYLNGTQKTKAEISEIFGEQYDLPTEESMNKMIQN